jgi:nucleoside-diphosphate-sugar epimerase
VSDASSSGRLEGRRIAITGVTGQVAAPVARALAGTSHVVGLARFSDPAAREELEASGVECCAVDLTKPDLSGVPADVDHVLHFAVTRIGRWDKDLTANGVGVGELISHFRGARSFLHCSSTAVYRPNGGQPMKETDPLGDHHGRSMPTYSISKIAAETVARFAAAHFELPTTIARLNVPYGDGGGWPAFHVSLIRAGQPIDVHPDGARYNPIHHRDITRLIPALLDRADVHPPVVNLAGDDVVSIEEWCLFLGDLVGHEPRFVEDDAAIPSAVIDTTLQHELVGGCEVAWRDGFRELVEG